MKSVTKFARNVLTVGSAVFVSMRAVGDPYGINNWPPIGQENIGGDDSGSIESFDPNFFGPGVDLFDSGPSIPYFDPNQFDAAL
jgi:hypothetical protein